MTANYPDLQSLAIEGVAAKLSLHIERVGAGIARIYQEQDLLPITLNIDANTVTLENGEEGGVIELVMAIKYLDIREAMQWLHKNFGKRRDKDDDEEKKTQAFQLVEIVQAVEPVLFHDELGDPYIRLPVNERLETMKVKSTRLRDFMKLQMFKSMNKIPSAEATNAAVDILAALARFESPQITLANRVALYNGDFFYDLANEQGEVVRITNNAWLHTVPAMPIFRPYGHQESQVLPIHGGSIELLYPFIPIEGAERLLYIVCLISYFIPEIVHPILVCYGEKGAAKTTTCLLVRLLVDPSKIDFLELVSSKNEMVQQLSHHWCCLYDNLSGFTDVISDCLCRAVTGGGHSKRQLYTDDEDIFYRFRRCIVLNGINLAAEKPDLLDRTISLKLKRISEDKRKEERKMLLEFEEQRPLILGAIFNVISKAKALRGSIELDNLPRLADFTLWGCAITEALGHSKEEFLEAYYDNIGDHHDEVIQASPVASALVSFMEDHEDWEGSPTELHSELEDIAISQKISIKSKEWPKAPNILTRRLNELETNLIEVGIRYTCRKGGKGRKIITLKTIATIATQEKTADVSEKEGDDTSKESITIQPPISTPAFALSKAIKSKGGDSDDVNFDPSLPF